LEGKDMQRIVGLAILAILGACTASFQYEAANTARPVSKDLRRALEEALVVVTASAGEPRLVSEGIGPEGPFRAYECPLMVDTWLKDRRPNPRSELAYTVLLPPRPEVVADVKRCLGPPNRHLLVFMPSEDAPEKPAPELDPFGEFRLQDYDPTGVPQVSAEALPDKVALLLAYSCCGQDIEPIARCVEGITSIASAVAVPVLRVALERHRGDGSYLAIMATLVTCGATDLIDRAALELTAWGARGAAHPDQIVLPHDIEAYGREMLIDALCGAVDRDRWRVLAPLVTHGNVHVRRAALKKLRKLKLPESAAVVARGLDDSDLFNQYQAGMALVEMWDPPGRLGPGWGGFAQEREKYVEAWKALAREHGAYPPPAK
jgi:hypothetical protein